MVSGAEVAMKRVPGSRCSSGRLKTILGFRFDMLLGWMTGQELCWVMLGFLSCVQKI